MATYDARAATESSLVSASPYVSSAVRTTRSQNKRKSSSLRASSSITSLWSLASGSMRSSNRRGGILYSPDSSLSGNSKPQGA